MIRYYRKTICSPVLILKEQAGKYECSASNWESDEEARSSPSLSAVYRDSVTFRTRLDLNPPTSTFMLRWSYLSSGPEDAWGPAFKKTTEPHFITTDKWMAQEDKVVHLIYPSSHLDGTKVNRKSQGSNHRALQLTDNLILLLSLSHSKTCLPRTPKLVLFTHYVSDNAQQGVPVQEIIN